MDEEKPNVMPDNKENSEESGSESSETKDLFIEISDSMQMSDLRSLILQNGSDKGFNWSWRLYSDDIKNASFEWIFDWDELQRQGIAGFTGSIEYTWDLNGRAPHAKRQKLAINRSGVSVKRELDECSRQKGRGVWKFSFNCIFKAIHCEYDYSLLEANFSESVMTDAVLLVEGKKLHVSKAFLSFHSQFFQDLFNSKKKTVKEFPIDNIKYEEFATFLSFVYPVPVLPAPETAAQLLSLAQRFEIAAVKNHVELYLKLTPDVRSREKILLADEFGLSDLLEQEIRGCDIKSVTKSLRNEDLSAATKCKLFDRIQASL